jgi:dephospho-CoA kinase
MLTIGLTGGIGSGKSEAAMLFQQLGVPVIDADSIAHQLVQPGTDTLAEVVNAFGEIILTPAGSLDRARLADIVFNNPVEKKRLESIIHPRVREQIRLYKDKYKADPYILVVIPLLLESGQRDLVDRILVVNAPESVRIQRVHDRDGRSDEQIRSIMQSQANDAARQAAADDILDNTGTLDDLQILVNKFHQHYMSLASKSPEGGS